MTETLSVIGVVLAAVVTYALGQRRDRQAHLRHEQVQACFEFCTAIMEYSAHQVHRRRDELRGRILSVREEDLVDEVVRGSRSRAWAAYFRVVLLVGEDEALLCRQALQQAADISKSESAGSDDRVKELGEAVRARTEEFISHMATVLGTRP